MNHKLSDTGRGRRQSPQPLFIRFGTSKFFHPTDRHSGVVRMRKFDKMELFCTDGFASSSSMSSYLTDIIRRDRNLVTIVCSGNNGFKIVDDEENYDDEDLDWERIFSLVSSLVLADEKIFFSSIFDCILVLLLIFSNRMILNAESIQGTQHDDDVSRVTPNASTMAH